MRQRTIASGNTLGAKYWTDGKVDAPMLPITPEVVACPHCRKVQWINDLKEAGEIPGPRGFGVPRPEYDKTFDHQPFIELPFADEYLEFLKSEKLLNDQELYLRWMYWHLMNDSRRNDPDASPLSFDEVANLKRLSVLIKLGNESSRLTIAEIHRELGDFVSCEKVLDHDFSEELIPAAQTIYFLQEEKISVVKPIFNDEAFIDAWNYRRKISNVELELDLPFDPSGPPIFEIKSRVWWIKILGMLQHNWALIEESGTGTATVFFFHDCGDVKMASHGYTKKQLEGRCAVIDSLGFQSVHLAEIGLIENGFRVHRKNEFLGSDVKPSGNFYDAREMEEGVYSTQGYWVK
jgi:hypothetical protein